MKCVICSLMGTIDQEQEQDAKYVVNGLSVCEDHMLTPLSQIENTALMVIVDAEDRLVRDARRRQREWEDRQSAARWLLDKRVESNRLRST